MIFSEFNFTPPPIFCHFNWLRLRIFLAVAGFGGLVLVSCEKDDLVKELKQEGIASNRSGDQSYVLESPDDLNSIEFNISDEKEERMRKAILQLSKAVMLSFQDLDVRHEMYYLLNNYVGRNPHYIALDDLLEFQESKRYQFSNVPSAYRGKFAQRFNAFVASQAASETGELMFYLNNENISSDNFFDFAKLFLYNPYISEEGESGYNPIIVPTTHETDESNGFRLNASSIEGYSQEFTDVTSFYETVLVNDEVAESEGAIIITPDNPDNFCDCAMDLDGDGFCDMAWEDEENVLPPYCGDPNDGDPCVPRNSHPRCSTNDDDGTGSREQPNPNSCDEDYCDHFRAVWRGYVTIKKPYEPLLNFNGNGGASEIWFCWLHGPADRNGDGHITFDDMVRPRYDIRSYSRKETRTDAAVWWNGNIEEDWPCDDSDRFLLIFEDDIDSETKLELSTSVTTGVEIPLEILGVSGKLKLEWKTGGKVGVTFSSEDQPYTLRPFNENTFFCNNISDIDGCGELTHRYGGIQNYLMPNETSRYNCGSDAWYTLPHGYREK